MDNMVMILFASVLTTVSALSFMELRRIRKNLERPAKSGEAAAKAS